MGGEAPPILSSAASADFTTAASAGTTPAASAGKFTPAASAGKWPAASAGTTPAASAGTTSAATRNIDSINFHALGAAPPAFTYVQNKKDFSCADLNVYSIFSKHYGIQPTLIMYISNTETFECEKVRLLIDPGSNVSFISRNVATRLKLTGPPVEIALNVASGQCLNTFEHEVKFFLGQVPPIQSENFEIVATTLKRIGNSLPKIDFDPMAFKHLKKLKFSEHFPSKNRRVLDVLLGEPYALRLIKKFVLGTLYQPSAVITPFGPALCGTDVASSPDFSTALAASRVPGEVDPLDEIDGQADVVELWQKMFDLSNIGINIIDKVDDKEKDADAEAIRRMKSVSRYDVNRKKWSTKLLFKEGVDKNLPDGYGKSRAVMQSTEKKIPVDLRPMVNEAYDEFLSTGIAEVVPEDMEGRRDHPTFVLPSRPVLKLDREKTKCRIIVNASVKSKNDNRTLNKMLITGPNLLPTVPAVVMRYRHKKFIFTLDIRKHFLQVELRDDEDRDMLRYLWRNFDENVRPTMYRHKVLGFGLVSSPFQAIWCVQETARMFGDKYPSALRVLHEDLYMDDIISGDENVELAALICREVVDCLQLGGFTAHKACCNDARVVKLLDPDRVDIKKSTKVLGHLWDTECDTLQFDLADKFPDQKSIESMSPITRCIIVSVGSTLFDTIGLVLPYQMQLHLIR